MALSLQILCRFRHCSLFVHCVIGESDTWQQRENWWLFSGVCIKKKRAGTGLEKSRQIQVYLACFATLSGVWMARPIRNPYVGLAESALRKYSAISRNRTGVPDFVAFPRTNTHGASHSSYLQDSKDMLRI